MRLSTILLCISIEVYSCKDRSVKVLIKDNGIGIKHDEVDNVFDLYYTTKREGTGLGLSITRKIIESHFGRIECRSTLGKGTDVIIYLPYNKMKGVQDENIDS